MNLLSGMDARVDNQDLDFDTGIHPTDQIHSAACIF